MKPGLTVYTNMPTPYQLDFFDALKSRFELSVVYFTEREQDRIWVLDASPKGYKAETLDNRSWISKFFSRFNSVHFSPSIINKALKDPNRNIIVNGTYWSPNVLLAILLSKWKGKKVAFWTEALFSTGNPIKRYLKKVSLLPLRKGTDLLMAIGKDAADVFREYGYNKPIHIVPYNINLSLFEDNALDTALMDGLTVKYRLRDKLVFLTSGALIHRKGMDTLVRAFRGIEANDCHLLIMGDGPERDTLETMIGDDKRISIIGFQPKEHVPSIFRLADVFVFASRYDGWGLVINEAVAAGCAIISTDTVGAVKDKLLPEGAAIVCEPGDADAFRREMVSFLGNREKLEKYRGLAKARRSYFSSAYCAEQVWRIFMAEGTNMNTA